MNQKLTEDINDMRKDNKEAAHSESPIGPLLVALGSDREYRDGWDANLTMACFDAIMTDEMGASMGHEAARRIAVASSSRFLDILTG